jgi:hypothetical protein
MKSFQQECKCLLQAGVPRVFYALIAIPLTPRLRMLTDNSWNYEAEFFSHLNIRQDTDLTL